MSQLTDLINLVKEDISNCVQYGSSAEYYAYGQIPQRCIDGALRSYVNLDWDETIIGLIDTTIFSGGERGVVFTDKGVYIREMLTAANFYRHDEYISVMSLSDEVYCNFYSIGNLMSKMSDVIESGSFNSLIDGISDVIDGIKDIVNNTATELMEAQGVFSALKNIINDLMKETENVDDVDDVEGCIDNVISFAVSINDEDEIENLMDEDKWQDCHELYDMVEDAVFTFESYGLAEQVDIQKALDNFENKIITIIDEYNPENSDTTCEKMLRAMRALKGKLKKTIRVLNDEFEKSCDTLDS